MSYPERVERVEGPPPARPSEREPVETPTVSQHQVSPGEGIEAVARQHEIKPSNLLQANPQLGANPRTDDGYPELMLGETLDIPKALPEDAEYYAARGDTRIAGDVAMPSPRLGSAITQAEIAENNLWIMENVLGPRNTSPILQDYRAALDTAEAEVDAARAASAPDPRPLTEVLSTDAEEVTAQSLFDGGSALSDKASAAEYRTTVDSLKGTVSDYLDLVQPGDRQEALQRLYDRDWYDAAPARAAIEEVAEAEGITLAPTSHAGPDVEAEARGIIGGAAAESDAAAALGAFNDGYADASPEVREALLANPAGRAIVTDAADWAAEPLNGDPNGEMTPQAMVAETMQRLDDLTEGVDPAVAARLFTEMLPKFSAANQRFLDYGGLIVGPNGTASLMTVFDRIAGTPEGDAAISRFAQQPHSVDWDTVTNAISSEGMNPAYAIAAAEQGGMVDNFVQDYILGSVEYYRDSAIAGQAEDYLEHIDELSFLIANGGAAMTDEQLNAAIDDYVAANPEWGARFEELQTQLGDSGARLLTQLQALQNMPDNLRADHQEQINGLLDDPSAKLAVSMALQQHPELVRGEAGRQLVETFAEVGITGADNPLAVNLAGAYLRENVIVPAGGIDPSDPTSLQDARGQISEALKDNPQLAAMLEVSPGQLDELADQFVELVPHEGTEFNAERYGIDATRNLNNALDSADALFRDNAFNRGFRIAALTIVGSGLANAAEAYGDDPSLRNALQLAVDSARVGIDGAQLVTSLFNPSTDSRLANGLKLGGKFVHLLGAGLSGISALQRLGQGDVVGAGLNAAVAGGVGYAAFGSSSLAGPIGFGIAAAATLGLFIWDGIQNAQHNSRFETETTAEFLRHAGFSEEAAQVLIDQSGEGYSPVPILMRYGELHGLTPEQTVNWINSIASSEDGPYKLAALRDNLHHTLDEIDGDVNEFDATADNDEERIWDTEQRPWFARSGVAQPESAAQLDAILPILEIEVPVP